MKTYARVKESLCFGNTSREWKEVKREAMQSGRNRLYFADNTSDNAYVYEIITVIL